MKKIAIIGAGLSGLSAAHLLKDHAEITVFEKARGVSGRMSTRRAGAYCFDHGAQYFTVRTQSFQNFIEPLIRLNIIKRWSPNYVKFSDDKIIETENWANEAPRYVGVPGMNQINKYLAEELNVPVNTRIVSLQRQDTWQLSDEHGQIYRDFDWVISTAPSPQTAALFPRAWKYHAAVKAIKMRACFCLMLGFSENLPLEFQAAHVTDADLSWIAVNSDKPGREDCFTLVVHSSEDYAQAHIDDDQASVMAHLIAETSRITGQDVTIADYKTIHRWRYAKNAECETHPVFLDQDLKLGACGSWCALDRVEGAFTSAYTLARAMKAHTL